MPIPDFFFPVPRGTAALTPDEKRRAFFGVGFFQLFALTFIALAVPAFGLFLLHPWIFGPLESVFPFLLGYRLELGSVFTAAIGLPFFSLLFREAARWFIAAELRFLPTAPACPNCRYALTGLTPPPPGQLYQTCPECGHTIDRRYR